MKTTLVRKLSLLSSLALSALLVGPANAEQPSLTVYVSTDGWIRSDQQTFAGADRLAIGQVAGGADLRALLDFDFKDVSLPTNAKFESATLSLYYVKDEGGSSGSLSLSVDVHELKTSFTGSATWLTSNGTDSWATNGGDFDATVLASKTVSASSTSSFQEFTGTGLDTLVETALENNSVVNLLLKASDEMANTDRQLLWFYSDSWLNGVSKAKLTIYYSLVPEPSTYALVAGVLLMMFCFVKRR
ncbi:PEP-CTERM putative exosortase interaction domain-containing protein [Opitutaceae bacterium TAV1]|nr:PEP-CTERM putative exosortase interaction domain-containing protein [Opitutaceae bacterium TAV1]